MHFVKNQAPARTFELMRTVPFGHCDPAGILYTPRALDVCLETIDEYWKSVLDGNGWFTLTTTFDRGSPFVNVNIDFRSPITAKSPIMIRLELTELGSSSVVFEIKTFQEGRLCFEAKMTCVLVINSKMAKVPQDDWLRMKLKRVILGHAD
jgi:acyl-CoA thioesterase FadM